MELTVTCLVCGQDVDLQIQMALPKDAPFGCPYCDEEVAEAIRAEHAKRWRAAAKACRPGASSEASGRGGRRQPPAAA